MVDRSWIERVSQLARLELDEEEKEKLLPQLQRILDFVSELKEVSTEGVEPFVPEAEETPMREDEPHKSFSQEEALMNAPQKERGFFVVPRIVEV